MYVRSRKLSTSTIVLPIGGVPKLDMDYILHLDQRPFLYYELPPVELT